MIVNRTLTGNPTTDSLSFSQNVRVKEIYLYAAAAVANVVITVGVSGVFTDTPPWVTGTIRINLAANTTFRIVLNEECKNILFLASTANVQATVLFDYDVRK